MERLLVLSPDMQLEKTRFLIPSACLILQQVCQKTMKSSVSIRTCTSSVCRKAGLVGSYADYPNFQLLGLGFVILHGQQIVSGASSYSTYKEGIEIEVDTHPAFRQQGLAKVVSAQLILACLAEGRSPSWDSHNKASLALAEKLGYVFSHEYLAYEFDW